MAESMQKKRYKVTLMRIEYYYAETETDALVAFHDDLMRAWREQELANIEEAPVTFTEPHVHYAETTGDTSCPCGAKL